MAYNGAATREAAPPRIKSWSFSAYKTYTQCPLKLKLSRIDKLPEAQSPQMAEGNRVHKLAEDFLNGKIEEVPDELKLFADDYRALRQFGQESPGAVSAECGATFRDDLTPTTWWAKDAWLRVKLDVRVLNDDRSAVIIDLKTGKCRKEDKDQLSLFALSEFLLSPSVEEVRTELWYSTGGELVHDIYQRSGLTLLTQEWLDKSAPMLRDTQFLPTPNGLCGYCSYSKTKGGPCTMA
jgi:RecB family exonuclease